MQLLALGTPRRLALLAVAVAAMRLWTLYMRRIAKLPGRWGGVTFDSAAAVLAAALHYVARMFGIIPESELRQLSAKRKNEFEGQKLIVFHPHGCYVLAAIVNLTTEPRNPKSPFFDTYICIAEVLLSLPGVREFCLLMNARPANPKMIDVLLKDGKNVCICPGGIYEQMATDSKQEKLFFPAKLGFVRQAIAHGVPLTPVYTFGENQLFDIPDWSRGLTKFVKRWTGAGFPMGIGRWGLPFVPKATKIKTVIGFNVDVGPADDSPSDEKVREVFLRYCAELRRLFDQHKDATLPSDIAAKGLQLIWRGHESEDLSLSALSAWAQRDPGALSDKPASESEADGTVDRSKL